MKLFKYLFMAIVLMFGMSSVAHAAPMITSTDGSPHQEWHVVGGSWFPTIKYDHYNSRGKLPHEIVDCYRNRLAPDWNSSQAYTDVPAPGFRADTPERIDREIGNGSVDFYGWASVEVSPGNWVGVASYNARMSDGSVCLVYPTGMVDAVIDGPYQVDLYITGHINLGSDVTEAVRVGISLSPTSASIVTDRGRYIPINENRLGRTTSSLFKFVIEPYDGGKGAPTHQQGSTNTRPTVTSNLPIVTLPKLGFDFKTGKVVEVVE